MNILKKYNIEKEATSGVSGPGSKFIRRDPNSRNQDHHDVHLTIYENLRALFALIIYITIFIVIIPIILYKNGFINFLKVYFLNTDLIATTISFDKGIFKNLFKYLYNDTGPLVGFISQSIINWLVLMGLFYIILIEGKNLPVSESLSKVGFILFITYLLPSRFLIKFQEDFYRKTGGKTHFNDINIDGLFTIIFGLFMVFILIIFENLVIHTFSDSFKKKIEYFFRTIR